MTTTSNRRFCRHYHVQQFRISAMLDAVHYPQTISIIERGAIAMNSDQRVQESCCGIEFMYPTFRLVLEHDHEVEYRRSKKVRFLQVH